MSQSKELGTLVVVVLKARHLHQPSFYKQDPYAQVTLSGQSQQTKPDPKGGQHPVWDEEFRFPVLADSGKDKVNRKMEVSCWKDEVRSEDKLLGKGVVDIESTLKTGEFDDWVPLETSGGARGELYLEMTFYANAPPPLNRRATKLRPSDRLARPLSYNPVPAKSGQPSASLNASSLSVPNTNPVQLRDSGYLPPAAVPASLLPTRGQPQTPSPSSSPGRQSAKSKTEVLPPLPEEAPVPQKKPPGHLPTILRPGPGGRAGRFRTPSGNNANTSDSSSLYTTPPTPISLLQTPVQERPVEELTGARTPLVIMNDLLNEHYQPSFPIAQPHTPEPQFHQEQGQGQSNHYVSSGQTPQQYYPAQQGYVPQQTLSPPPQQYQQSYTPQNYAPSSPQPQQYAPSSPHLHQYQPQQAPPPVPQYQPSSSPHQTLHMAPQYQPSPSPHPQSFSPQPYPGPPPAPQSYTPIPSQQPYPPQPQPQSQAYAYPAQQQPQTYVPAPPQQQPYQQQSYFHPPPPQNPVPPPPQSPVPPPTQPPPRAPYFSPPPPPPPLPGNQQGTPAVPRVEQQSSPVQGYKNAAPTASAALGLGATSTSPSQTSPGQPLFSSAVPTVPEDEKKREEDERAKAEEERTRDEERRKMEDERKAAEEERTRDEERRKIEDERKAAEEERTRDEERRKIEDERKAAEEAELRRREAEEVLRRAADERKRQEEEELKRREVEEQKRREEERLKWEAEQRKRDDEERRRRDEEERLRRDEEERRRVQEERRKAEDARRKQEEEERIRREEEARRRLEEERRKHDEELHRKLEEEARRKREEDEARRNRAEEEEAERRWQIELARIKARAEQEAADAAFARAQFEAEETERRRQEEADLAFARRAHEENEREHRAAEERRRQEEIDSELARREQAHEEELERKRVEVRRRRVEETDREMARKLDMELNLEPGNGDASSTRPFTAPQLPSRRRAGSPDAPGGW